MNKNEEENTQEKIKMNKEEQQQKRQNVKD